MKIKVEVKIAGCLIFLLALVIIVVVQSLDQPEEKAPEEQKQSEQAPEQETNKGLKEQIEQYLEKEEIDADEIAIYLHNFVTGQEYMMNPDSYFAAGSVYKVPLAMIYYERIEHGELSLTSKIYYDEAYAEDPDASEANYMPNTSIELTYLLDDMIVNSNNTAAHILFENLGGWISFKEEAAVFGEVPEDDVYYSYDNVFTARYLKDVLSYLQGHRDTFQGLIELMVKSGSGEYLDRVVSTQIAQKYGEYDTAENAIGIVYGTQPYSIVVLTDAGAAGKAAIGDINKICYDYFYK